MTGKNLSPIPSLKEYKKKRAFDKTSEPLPGKKNISSSSLHFVVQKHAASHLHYDLRLEMQGVLKSWAVPKGPSLNPKEKRLAIMVEDHPYDYKDFEGIIPQGSYGAGKVIIWDEGIYELKKGSSLFSGILKFILQGHKLKGEFALIKMKNSDKNWLLIKIDDSFSTEKDVLDKAKSVRSKATRLALAQNTGFCKKSNNSLTMQAPKKPMLKLVKPMLAHLAKKPFNREGWIFEIKWDGYRIIAYLHDHHVRLLSRNQQDYTKNYQPVSTELASLDINAVLDGEMVVVDSSGHSRFQQLQQYSQTGKGNLLYYIFDLLWLNGHDLRNLPLIQRKDLLSQFFPSMNYIRVSEHIQNDGEDFFQVAVAQGLEGIMAKDGESRYQEGKRSLSWLKIKTQPQQEFIICGYTKPRGSRSHLGSLILGMFDHKNLQYVGHVGTGFNEDTLDLLKIKLDKITQPNFPFAKLPPHSRSAVWVKPQLVCEVSFTEWTKEGQLRHPVFKGLREDKSAQEVYPEKSVVDEQDLVINGHHLHLTHLTKVYWPDLDLTKGDLINYYRKISSTILPYLKNRPLSLNRHPNGITGKSFFQKNFTASPQWVVTSTVYSNHEGKEIHYLVCQNEATLIYLAQLGCIEINPWLSQIQSLDFPDYCVLDLDPEHIDFTAVVKTAQAIHQLLDTIGVDHYCKTSGATGLHIYIPLGGKYTYDQSTQFAQLIATLINNQLPDITSVQRLPSKRQKKVYIDYLQNHYGQTVAAAYSLRPRLGAPVSSPLLWRELNSRLDPSQFNIFTIYKRLEKMGDIWESLLKHKGIDLLTCIEKLSEKT